MIVAAHPATGSIVVSQQRHAVSIPEHEEIVEGWMTRERAAGLGGP